ncbi:hypothetical protein HX880_32870, partial [Pseudomonas sp. F1002]|nr:hypothetical protein [Pseudomonas sp. F1002]
RPLEPLGNDHIYNDALLQEKWDGLLNYRRNGQLADLYIGNPETLDYTITLSG